MSDPQLDKLSARLAALKDAKCIDGHMVAVLEDQIGHLNMEAPGSRDGDERKKRISEVTVYVTKLEKAHEQYLASLPPDDD